MGAARNDRIGRWVAVFLGTLVGGLAAVPGGSASELESAKAKLDPDVAVLSDVMVDQKDGSTVVTLHGVVDPVYSATESKDPWGLVLRLEQVRTEGIPDSLILARGAIQEVALDEETDESGSVATEIDFAMKSPFEYQLVAREDGLEVWVTPSAPSEAAAEASAEPSAEASAPAAAAVERPAPVIAMPQLEAIESEPNAEGTQIRLRTSAPVENPESFVLESPGRLVIDLAGFHSKLREPQVAIEASSVSRVRVGQHPDKVRIVFDSAHANARFADYSLVPVQDGLIVQIAASEKIAELGEPGSEDAGPTVVVSSEQPAMGDPAMRHEDPRSEMSGAPAAPAPEGFEAQSFDAPKTEVLAAPITPARENVAVADVEVDSAHDQNAEAKARTIGEEAQALRDGSEPSAPAASEDSGTVHVTSIAYDDSEPQHIRIVIASDSPPNYHLFEPDPATVILSLLDSVLSPEAAVRIAPKEGDPVSLIMAFQQPDLTRPEVRIVMTRGAGLEPQIETDGSNVSVSFAKSGVAAATPPAMRKAMAMASAGAAATAPAATPPASASTAAAKAMSAATRGPIPQAPPAAIESDDGIGVLQEGGLLHGKQYLGRRISLDFKDVDIDDVLRLLAEVSDLNIIAADNVGGKVTLRLIDVPWDQALDLVLLSKGLGFVKVGNVLRIAPQTVLQKEAESRLQERRAKEKLEDLVVKFQPVNYARVSSVKTMVARLLTGRGSVNTDARTNTIIIKDIPTVIDEAVALIKAVDTPTPQVLIEAKIVEANLDFSRELGTEWGSNLLDFNPNDGTPYQNGRFHNDPSILTGASELNNFVVTNPLASAPTALMNLGAFILDDRWNVELQLQAAESTGEGKVISSPRIVTLDNSQASIKQGVAIPFQTFENGDAQLEFVEAVLELSVKPHITADRSIIMDVQISRNAPDEGVAAPPGSTAIGKNEAKTQTLVRDGQTLVIGGIYTIQKSDRQTRVPFLHRIPVLGLLFRNSLVRDFRKELLVFVTPRIIEAPQLGE